MATSLRVQAKSASWRPRFGVRAAPPFPGRGSARAQYCGTIGRIPTGSEHSPPVYAMAEPPARPAAAQPTHNLIDLPADAGAMPRSVLLPLLRADLLWRWR